MKHQGGQGGLMFVLITGVILAVIVMFGWSKQQVVASVADRVENAMIAQEVTSAAAQRVQKMYAEEAGCDPDVLDRRLSNLPELGASPPAGLFYAIAATRKAPALPVSERYGLCSGGTGCRQIPADVEGRRYIATIGKVSALAAPVAPVGPNCPRDATVKIRTTIENAVYFRRITLINTCSFKSCSGGPTYASFDAVTSDVTANTLNTTACASIAARRFGALTQAAHTQVDVNDLRFARRYLSTGAGDSGDTTFLLGAVNTAPCAAGTGGCLNKSCIPGLDLNRDGANNEADLAILEYYLRGFIPQLPVRSF